MTAQAATWGSPLAADERPEFVLRLPGYHRDTSPPPGAVQRLLQQSAALPRFTLRIVGQFAAEQSAHVALALEGPELAAPHFVEPREAGLPVQQNVEQAPRARLIDREAPDRGEFVEEARAGAGRRRVDGVRRVEQERGPLEQIDQRYIARPDKGAPVGVVERESRPGCSPASGAALRRSDSDAEKIRKRPVYSRFS
jgi:hypothetical protein